MYHSPEELKWLPNTPHLSLQALIDQKLGHREQLILPVGSELLYQWDLPPVIDREYIFQFKDTLSLRVVRDIEEANYPRSYVAELTALGREEMQGGNLVFAVLFDQKSIPQSVPLFFYFEGQLNHPLRQSLNQKSSSIVRRRMMTEQDWKLFYNSLNYADYYPWVYETADMNIVEPNLRMGVTARALKASATQREYPAAVVQNPIDLRLSRRFGVLSLAHKRVFGG